MRPSAVGGRARPLVLALGACAAVLAYIPEDPTYKTWCEDPVAWDQCTGTHGCRTRTPRMWCRRASSDECCCCPKDPVESEYCRVDGHVWNASTGKYDCRRSCCDTGSWPCGSGCCPQGLSCGFNFTQHMDSSNKTKNFQCCVDPKSDLADQDKKKCCAWGVGTDCREPGGNVSCCLKCTSSGQKARNGMLYCDVTEPEYHCQRHDSCAAWEAHERHILVLEVALGAALAVSALATMCLACCWKRLPSRLRRACLRACACCRRRAQGDDPLLSGDQHRLAHDRPPWFGLLVGDGTNEAYELLERVEDDIRRLEEKLKEVQPGLCVNGHLLTLTGCHVTRANLESARNTLLAKIASTREARVIFYYGGHGFENLIAARDAMVPIDQFFEGFRLASRSALPLQRAIRPRVMAFFDCCRDPPPREHLVAAQRENFEPRLPRGTDGRIHYIFANLPGQSTPDGVFTDALLEKLGVPGLKLGELVEEIGKSVGSFQRVQLVSDSGTANLVINEGPCRSARSSNV